VQGDARIGDRLVIAPQRDADGRDQQQDEGGAADRDAAHRASQGSGQSAHVLIVGR